MFGFGKSFRIARIFSIDIEVDVSWLLIFCFFVWIGSGIYSGGLTQKVLIGITFASLFYLGLFLHELSHALVSKMRGINVSRMKFMLLGAGAFMDEQPRSPKDEFLIGIVGPLTSFLVAVVFFVVSRLIVSLNGPEVLVNLSVYLVFANCIIGAFNMLPAYPLDGGRCIARAFLWWIYGDHLKSIKQACQLGRMFGWLIVLSGALGVIMLFVCPQYLFWNPVWMLIIGWFLLNAARGSYYGYILSVRKVRECGRSITEIMLRHTSDYYNWPRISADATLMKAIETMRSMKWPILLVEDDGKIVGEISERDITIFIENQ